MQVGIIHQQKNLASKLDLAEDFGDQMEAIHEDVCRKSLQTCTKKETWWNRKQSFEYEGARRFWSNSTSKIIEGVFSSTVICCFGSQIGEQILSNND